MDKIKTDIVTLRTKYAPYITMLIANMRLVLLLAFSVMAGYLIWRVNSLVNQDVTPKQDSSSPLSKRPDKDVLSTFNELYIQDVDIQASFQANRENPF
jgi:hypothetical protein